MHEHFTLVLILLAIAAGTTAISKKLNQPYPIALVLVGTLIGLLPISNLESLKNFIAEDEIFRFAIISIFLPTLLGEATLKLPLTNLKENKKPIIALAFLGTILSYIIVGLSVNIFLDLPIQVAFVFAALMSATDPVSVLSIFKSIGVNNKLSTIIEGESLFNDGMAVVLFNISAFYLAKYLDIGALGAVYGSMEFIKIAVGGVIIGGTLGYLFSILIKFYDDYPLEIIFSMLLFYGSFFIAEHFDISGVIAVVTAGLVFGNYGGKIGMSPTTKLNLNNFWDALALLANSLVFLMIGLEITRIHIPYKWTTLLFVILIVLLARSISVYGSLLFIRKVPLSWKHILNWGGLRGSLSIALALSLPLSFPGRETILLFAFSVVLFSLLVQGLSIKKLITYLGLSVKSEALKEYELIFVKVHRYKSALDEFEKMKNDALISDDIYEKLVTEYSNKLIEEHKLLKVLYNKSPELKKKQLERAKKQALYREHAKIEELVNRNIISSNLAEKEKEAIINMIES